MSRPARAAAPATVRVLVPRGGEWGRDVAARLGARGFEPLVVPLVATRSVHDDPLLGPALTAALADLAAGRYAWLALTSAAAVDVLGRLAAPGTRVAAVGPATAAALAAAGHRVDLVPPADHSAAALVAAWPPAGDDPRPVLVVVSDLAAPTLADGLRAAGHAVHVAVGYRTVSLDPPDDVVAALRGGAVHAVLVTSGSVARAVAACRPLPPGVLVVCLGPRTAAQARAAGLTVHVVAAQRSAASLVDALSAGVSERRTT